MSDFSECVIIPLDVYKTKCNLGKESQTRQERVLREDLDLLYDASIPSDVKMKLYTQQTKMRPHQPKHEKVEIVKAPESDLSVSGLQRDAESILQGISKKNVPFAESILTKILQNQSLIKWNEKLEVKIRQLHIPNSNIIDLLKYVLGERIITSTGDVPAGALEFYQVLMEIGVPSSWLKIRRKEVESMRSWISL